MGWFSVAVKDAGKVNTIILGGAPHDTRLDAVRVLQHSSYGGTRFAAQPRKPNTGLTPSLAALLD